MIGFDVQSDIVPGSIENDIQRTIEHKIHKINKGEQFEPINEEVSLRSNDDIPPYKKNNSLQIEINDSGDDINSEIKKL